MDRTEKNVGMAGLHFKVSMAFEMKLVEKDFVRARSAKGA